MNRSNNSFKLTSAYRKHPERDRSRKSWQLHLECLNKGEVWWNPRVPLIVLAVKQVNLLG
jgi:hypothetical protein